MSAGTHGLHTHFLNESHRDASLLNQKCQQHEDAFPHPRRPRSPQACIATPAMAVARAEACVPSRTLFRGRQQAFPDRTSLRPSSPAPELSHFDVAMCCKQTQNRQTACLSHPDIPCIPCTAITSARRDHPVRKSCNASKGVKRDIELSRAASTLAVIRPLHHDTHGGRAGEDPTSPHLSHNSYIGIASEPDPAARARDGNGKVRHSPPFPWRIQANASTSKACHVEATNPP